MKASELRIGNLVWEDYGGIYEVLMISPNQVDLVKPLMSIPGRYSLEPIKPIPLTEEWLEKFGFKPKGEGYSYTNLLMYDFRESYSMFEWDSYNEVEVCIKNDIKYVHHLQNLYFALTGEELKLKEAGKAFYESADKVIIVKRQETLEEMAQEYFENNIFCDGITEFEKDVCIKSFIAAAKWQAERMYSEEDLRNAYFSGISSTGEGWNGEYADGNSPNVEETFSEGFKEWFEQFKKK